MTILDSNKKTITPPPKTPRQFDVVLELSKGSLAKQEFSNTIYILVDRHTSLSIVPEDTHNQKVVEKVLYTIPGATWGVTKESASLTIYNLRVTKMVNIHAILDELVSKLKAENLTVGKS